MPVEAVDLFYDDDRRLVGAVGAHGIDLELFAGASPTADQLHPDGGGRTPYRRDRG